MLPRSAGVVFEENENVSFDLGARDRELVVPLLERHAHRWNSCSAASAVLVENLGVPLASLAAARALAARSALDDAAEFAAWAAAGEFPLAHSVLCRSLAPRLFLLEGGGRGKEGHSKLREALALLSPHAGEVDAALGSGSWRRGAGVFASFFALSDGEEGEGGQGQSGSGDLRVAALADLADALRSAASSPLETLPATSPRDASRLAALRGCALGEVAGQLAKWFLRCGGGTNSGEEQGGGSGSSSLARLAECAVAAASMPALQPDERAGVVCAAAAALAGVVA
jgi:hypothetical protein